MASFQAPMRLLCDGEPFGTVTTYSYETPWATGHFEALNQGLHERCMQACAFLQWVNNMPDELSDDEADRLYEQELTRRELAEDDLRWCSSERWAIVTDDREEHFVNSLFFEDDFVQWRW